MRRVFLSALLGAAASLTGLHAAATPAAALAPPPSPAPATVKLTADQIGVFRKFLEDARAQAGVPGMAVALVQPNQVILLAGFGQRSAAGNGNVTADTRFALGQATEAVNSLLLSRLDDQNVLDLDAPARRCWDEFKFDDANSTATVSLRELLNMTSGLPGRADHFVDRPDATPADLFAVVAQMEDADSPGHSFDYCDSGCAAAGYLAVYMVNHHHAPAAGLPAGYAALAQEQIFGPLGMKRATFDLPAPTDDAATGHTRTDQGGWQASALPAKNDAALLPARGLWLSANDAVPWLQCELSGGLGPNGQRLLPENLVEQRWRPTPPAGDRDFGLGWATQRYRGLELVARLSEQDDQASLAAIVPQYRTAIVVLTNAGGHPAALFLQNILLNLADFLSEAATQK